MTKVIRKTDAMKAIQGEIEWCQVQVPDQTLVGKTRRKGFIAGLRQAKRLLREMPAMKGGKP